jgi:hypothetical protein
VGVVAESYGHLAFLEDTAMIVDEKLHFSVVHKIQLYL